VRFRLGLIVGLGIGYVLGARAGVERYEQIRRWAVEARRHPAVAELGRDAVGVGDALRLGIAAGLETGSRLLRRRTG